MKIKNNKITGSTSGGIRCISGLIKKFGKVLIAEDNIMITEFQYDGNSFSGLQREALEWAKQRIERELRELKPLSIISIEL